MPRQGSTTQRGYGHIHQHTRKQEARKVEAGEAYCWRCLSLGIPPEQAWIPPGSAWDLGHDDLNREVTRGAEHRGRGTPCGGNRATAGRRHKRTPAPALAFFD